MLMPKPQLHYLGKENSHLYGVVGRGVSFMSKEKSKSSKRCFHMFSLNGMQKNRNPKQNKQIPMKRRAFPCTYSSANHLCCVLQKINLRMASWN